MDLAYNYRTLLKQNGINSNLRMAHFFAQIHHESGLEPISENLNYSTNALIRVFGKYFPNVDIAKSYSRQPRKIANRVYANRMENGDEYSGDGWRYRGRGFIQVTGKRNYRLLSKYTGIDYLYDPDLLLTEADAMVAALWYWNKNNLNKYADLDDLDAISDLINIGRVTERYGDANGFGHRKELLRHYKIKFDVR